MKAGFNRTGSQRYQCQLCRRAYTPQPLPLGYDDKTRATRCIVSHAVCFERTPELLQAVVDAAPQAARYCSDAFNTYKELCRWGAHQARRDKAETYSVEGDNTELRHYPARLTRRSRCFSKCIQALRRAVELFVWCWNQQQLRKQQHPHYPTHLIISSRV